MDGSLTPLVARLTRMPLMPALPITSRSLFRRLVVDDGHAARRVAAELHAFERGAVVGAVDARRHDHDVLDVEAPCAAPPFPPEKPARACRRARRRTDICPASGCGCGSRRHAAGTSKFTFVVGCAALANAARFRIATPAATDASKRSRRLSMGRLPYFWLCWLNYSAAAVAFGPRYRGGIAGRARRKEGDDGRHQRTGGEEVKSRARSYAWNP